MNAVARITFVTIFVVLGGCSTTQEMLEPRVCDYEAERNEVRQDCERQSVEIAGAIADHEVARARTRADDEGQETARELERMAREEDEGDDDLYRAPEELAEEPINPVVADSDIHFEDQDDRDEFEETRDIAPPEEGQVFRGRFTGGERQTVAIHRPGQTLALYSGDGRRISTVDLDEYDRQIAPEDDIMDFETGAIELVQDGTEQLQLLHAESDEDGRVTYYLRIYKFIGSRIGTIFSRPVAVRDGDDLQRIARPRYLHGLDHRIIEWTPLDEEGEAAAEPEQFEWNRWEGVYRIPEPPPTAPTSQLGASTPDFHDETDGAPRERRRLAAGAPI